MTHYCVQFTVPGTMPPLLYLTCVWSGGDCSPASLSIPSGLVGVLGTVPCGGHVRSFVVEFITVLLFVMSVTIVSVAEELRILEYCFWTVTWSTRKGRVR